MPSSPPVSYLSCLPFSLILNFRFFFLLVSSYWNSYVFVVPKGRDPYPSQPYRHRQKKKGERKLEKRGDTSVGACHYTWCRSNRDRLDKSVGLLAGVKDSGGRVSSKVGSEGCVMMERGLNQQSVIAIRLIVQDKRVCRCVDIRSHSLRLLCSS